MTTKSRPDNRSDRKTPSSSFGWATLSSIPSPRWPAASTASGTTSTIPTNSIDNRKTALNFYLACSTSVWRVRFFTWRDCFLLGVFGLGLVCSTSVWHDRLLLGVFNLVGNPDEHVAGAALCASEIVAPSDFPAYLGRFCVSVIDVVFL